MTEPEYRYLLGRLDEAEREAFAARFLEDPELLARVEEAENDLFDAYASGRLSGDDSKSGFWVSVRPNHLEAGRDGW